MYMHFLDRKRVKKHFDDFMSYVHKLDHLYVSLHLTTPTMNATFPRCATFVHPPFPQLLLLTRITFLLLFALHEQVQLCCLLLTCSLETIRLFQTSSREDGMGGSVL